MVLFPLFENACIMSALLSLCVFCVFACSEREQNRSGGKRWPVTLLRINVNDEMWFTHWKESVFVKRDLYRERVCVCSFSLTSLTSSIVCLLLCGFAALVSLSLSAALTCNLSRLWDLWISRCNKYIPGIILSLAHTYTHTLTYTLMLKVGVLWKPPVFLE